MTVYLRAGRITPIFYKATFRWRRGGRVTYQHRDFVDTVAYADRGKLWARGWEGREVDALKAAVALR